MEATLYFDGAIAQETIETLKAKVEHCQETADKHNEHMMQMIAQLKASVEIRCKCAIADCSLQGLGRNRVEINVVGTANLCLYLCDEHYGKWVQS